MEKAMSTLERIQSGELDGKVVKEILDAELLRFKKQRAEFKRAYKGFVKAANSTVPPGSSLGAWIRRLIEQDLT